MDLVEPAAERFESRGDAGLWSDFGIAVRNHRVRLPRTAPSATCVVFQLTYGMTRVEGCNMTDQPLTLEQMRAELSSAVVCDALDSLGYSHLCPRVALSPLTTDGVLVGRCKTTLWGEMAHADPAPYELELKAVDACQVDDVLIAAASGSMRSGIWGELLSTAAMNTGCVGAIVDGAVRDVGQMRRMEFPVFAEERVCMTA